MQRSHRNYKTLCCSKNLESRFKIQEMIFFFLIALKHPNLAELILAALLIIYKYFSKIEIRRIRKLFIDHLFLIFNRGRTVDKIGYNNEVARINTRR